MSDAATGSAILSGNPAETPADQTGGTSAPAATTPASTTTTTPDTGNWYDKIEDAELKGYVQNKGWKDPSELAHGYKNLEKLLGGEKLPMPKGAEDKEGWARVYDSLGRPKSAEEYKLPVPEGADGEFAKVASGKFHELGLSAQQAQGLAEWYNQLGGAKVAEMQQQSAAKSEADLSALRTEWGGAYDENVQFGRMAAREYGLDAAKLTALENSLGTAEMLKLMAKIGRAQGEGEFVSGNSSNRFGMTPEAAKQRISALQQDNGWSAKYLQGDADAKAELQKLMSLAYPQ